MFLERCCYCCWCKMVVAYRSLWVLAAPTYRIRYVIDKSSILVVGSFVMLLYWLTLFADFVAIWRVIDWYFVPDYVGIIQRGGFKGSLKCEIPLDVGDEPWALQRYVHWFHCSSIYCKYLYCAFESDWGLGRPQAYGYPMLRNLNMYQTTVYTT